MIHPCGRPRRDRSAEDEPIFRWLSAGGLPPGAKALAAAFPRPTGQEHTRSRSFPPARSRQESRPLPAGRERHPPSGCRKHSRHARSVRNAIRRAAAGKSGPEDSAPSALSVARTHSPRVGPGASLTRLLHPGPKSSPAPCGGTGRRGARVAHHPRPGQQHLSPHSRKKGGRECLSPLPADGASHE